MNQQGYLRAEVIEIGCGLGDLALNYLNALDRYSAPIIHYRMYDISPSLIEIDRNRLGDRVQDYILADCLDLTQHIPSFGGTIVSNGLMADLRSVYISHNDQLPTYNVTDEDLADFVSDHQASEKRIGWYLHVGSLQFLREIAACLDSGGVALLAEYSATDRNQPARFDGHFECGIDFNQLLSYADRPNLETKLVDIEDILGISPDQPFLSIDVFTLQDRLAHEVPATVKLWTAQNPLPVLAYTRKSLFEMLSSDIMGFSESDSNLLVEALDPYFHSTGVFT